MTTFNTATIHEITDDFGDVEKYRVVLNTGTHEYYVTDLFEAKDVKDVIEHSVTNWPTAQLVIGHKI
ncbi:hypothetical protein [Erwinia phage Virsaitis27]|nr:hypothetical protein [Erwinia phage Virsaitis27]